MTEKKIDERKNRGRWARFLTKVILCVPVARRTLAERLWKLCAEPGWGVWSTAMGMDMYLDLAKPSHSHYFFGVYEQGTTRVLCEMFKPGTLFLDIGANCGYFSLLASRRVGHNGKVVAFEPDPTVIPILEKNLSLNDSGQVELHKKAVGDRIGKMSFLSMQGAWYSHLCLPSQDTADSASPEGNDNWVRVEVDVTTLDAECLSLARSWQGDIIMKMDIEGAEPLALSGAHGLLDRLHAAVIEVAGGMQRKGFAEDVFNPFLERGFIAHYIRERDGKLKSLPEPVAVPGNVLFLR